VLELRVVRWSQLAIRPSTAARTTRRKRMQMVVMAVMAEG
jgi:hypothetical protein